MISFIGCTAGGLAYRGGAGEISGAPPPEFEFGRFENELEELENEFQEPEFEFLRFQNEFELLENEFQAAEIVFQFLQNEFEALEFEFQTLENEFESVENEFQQPCRIPYLPTPQALTTLAAESAVRRTTSTADRSPRST